jgi:RNA polymerase sigma-70 factor (ECF subfamily)
MRTMTAIQRPEVSTAVALLAEPESREVRPDDVAAQHDSASKALQLLAGLTENQQDCIRLKFQNGLSYKEISQVTGLSVSNVGYLIHTGLKKIRQQMKQEQ